MLGPFAHCMIDNTASGRIHVCLFYVSPLPGGVTVPRRWKSKGHHTAGAATQEEADQHLAMFREHLGVSTTVDLGRAEWDGQGVPALVMLDGG
jgi:hypothetical protein